MGVSVAVGIPVQDNLGAACRHGVDLDVGRGGGHDDDGLALQALRGQRHALRMVAGGSGDHATFQGCSRKLRHLVVSATQLEGKH
jgi:hypothetical protein